ncbi:MAG: hypothetical protein WBC93_10190 [Sulfitobacter sp.]
MSNIVTIRIQESVVICADQLGALWHQVGPAHAEDIVCRAMEELATKIHQSTELHGCGDFSALRKNVHSLIAVADQVGLVLLSKIASDVTRCIDRGDALALAATMARLTRVAEQSLTEIWDAQGITS